MARRMNLEQLTVYTQQAFCLDTWSECTQVWIVKTWIDMAGHVWKRFGALWLTIKIIWNKSMLTRHRLLGQGKLVPSASEYKSSSFCDQALPLLFGYQSKAGRTCGELCPLSLTLDESLLLHFYRHPLYVPLLFCLPLLPRLSLTFSAENRS